MNTVTSFSASLLQSLDGDTAAAAEKANLAITDMSDNANKMGSDMASIQNAYQGFAKQNYTMLDNLKLGYGGTKQEMERLLEDAQKLSGVKYDISSYSDIVDAIHVVQTEMGITGTTALEASTTIEGSVNSAKKAWKNWVTGIGNSNADMAQLTGNLLSSVTTAADNILPVISTVFDSIGEVIDTQGEEIINTGISFISGSVPGLLTAGITLVGDVAKGISSNLPALIGSITAVIEENLPTLLAAGRDLLFGIVTGIVENLPSILDAGLNILGELTAGIDEGIPDMMNDNYAAYLHKGEAVLTASEASLWRNGTARNGGGTVVNQYINAVPQTPVELAAATAAYFEQARWTI